MELGLGSGIEKVEEYFGKAYTRALVFIVTLAMAVLALSTLYSLVGKPAYELITAGKVDPVFWHNLGSTASPLSTALLLVVAIYFSVVDTIRARKDRAKIEEIEKLLAQATTDHPPH